MKKLIEFLFRFRPVGQSKVIPKLVHELYFGIIDVDEVSRLGNLVLGYCDNPELTLLFNKLTKETTISCNGEILDFPSLQHTELFRKLFLYNHSVWSFTNIDLAFESDAWYQIQMLFPISRSEMIDLATETEDFVIGRFAENRARCLRSIQE